MPTLRVRGLPSYGHVSCVLETASGEEVGAVSAQVKFYASPSGAREIVRLPIPVRHPGAPSASVEDLYGQEATLDCVYEPGDGLLARQTLSLVLAEGLAW